MLTDAEKTRVKNWEAKNMDSKGRYIGPFLRFFSIQPGQYVDYLWRGLQLVKEWDQAFAMKDGAKVGDYLTTSSGMGGSFDFRVLEVKKTDSGVYYSGVIDSRVPSGAVCSEFHGRRWGGYERDCKADADGAAMKRLPPVKPIEWASA